MQWFEIIEQKYYHKIFILAGAAIISGILSGAMVILILHAAHVVAERGDYSIYLIILPLTVGLHVISRRLCQQQANLFAEHLLEKITLGICNAVRQTELVKFETYRSSDIYLPLTDAQVLIRSAVKGLEAFQNLITIGVLWFYIWTLSTLIGLFMLGIFFLILLGYEFFQNIMNPLAREQSRFESRLFDIFQHILDGFKEIKINSLKRNDLFDNYLIPGISELKQSRTEFAFYFTETGLFTYISLFILMLTLAFVFSPLYSYEAISDVLIITLFISKPFWNILAIIPDIEYGKAAYGRIREIFGKVTAGQVSEPDIPQERIITGFEEIHLENIRFSYLGSEGAGFSVGPFNLGIRAGESLFVTGGNGSGKSTFVKLLTGLYSPDSGRFTIDEKKEEMIRHRYLFSAVFTDFHLFDRIYGMDEIDEKRVNALLKEMALSHKTTWDKEKFSMPNLSAGQKRRLALIIALLEDKPICIFDEWAADQDPDFRAYFYENIIPSLKQRGKTVVVVTHDEKYFALADQLVKMEDGNISEIIQQKSVPGDDRICTRKEILENRGSRYTLRGGKQTRSQEERGNRKETDISDQIRSLFISALSSLRPRISSMVLSIIAEITLVGIPFSVLTAFYHNQPTARYFLLSVVTLFLYMLVFRRFERYLPHVFEANLSGIRLKLMNKVRNMDLRSFEKNGNERIYTVLTHDINAMSAVSHLLAISLRITFRMVTIMLSLSFISWKAALVCCFIALLSGMYYIFNQVMIFHALEEVRTFESKVFGGIRHLLEGFRELRLNRKKSDDFFHKGLKRYYRLLGKARAKLGRYILNNDSVVFGTSEILLITPVLLAPVTDFFYGQDMILFTAFILFLPVTTLLHTFPRVVEAAHSWQRLDDLEHTLGTVGQETPEDSEYPSFDSLRYEGIRFQYGTDKGLFSVGPATFSFHPGEIVFITGGNGSGKTTLIKVMTGLYPIHSGVFWVNGKPADIRNCRSLFSVIFYDFHLFDRLYGYPDADEAKIRELIGIMKLEKKVGYAENRFSTLDLSTGQRKRLAMISAIMENRPVYIFDEWAAGQDPHFRKYFYETLLPSFKAEGKTVIAVTHDDRWFHVADRVLKLEYGQLADS